MNFAFIFSNDPAMRMLLLIIIAILAGNLYGKARMEKRAASVDEKKLYSRFSMASMLVSLICIPVFILAPRPYNKLGILAWGFLMFFGMRKLIKDKEALAKGEKKEEDGE